jgi:hypothetical protein
MRGLRDPSGQSLERARENRMEKDTEGVDGKEGGEGRYLWSSRKSGRAQPRALSLIRRLLNSEGQPQRLRLLHVFSTVFVLNLKAKE